MGCSITQWYGMTEASPSVISQRENEVEVVGSVGKLLPGMSMKIVDHEGKGAFLRCLVYLVLTVKQNAGRINLENFSSKVQI